jgi:hypothetical protein
MAATLECNSFLSEGDYVFKENDDAKVHCDRMPYSDECVLTFEQIRQQMEKAMELIKNPNKNARKSPNEPDLKSEPKISIKDSGETRVINGYNTRHMIVSVQLEGQDQKSKDKGSFEIHSDLWLTKDIRGVEEQNVC